jgi:Tol biopolymer transport system component
VAVVALRRLAWIGVGVVLVAGCGSSSKQPAATTTAAAVSASGGHAIVTHSPDSDAPANAPAHWLPPFAWVYNHWLPYDETRLYSLVHITRNQLWDQLRNDHNTLAQLAAKHGWKDPVKLAAALVAPERAKWGAARAAVLQSRALQTITQGHLAQHLFFHSLHQFAIASEAPDIFGVTDVEFRALRRAELSPLAIGRLHGRSPGEVEAMCIAVLRERARTGVEGKAMTPAQANRILSRQISQLPRWLDQARYNGPPQTYKGALVALPHDYATNPSISADGRHVAYEAYRQKLPVAIKLGEIAVMRADLDDASDTIVSRLPHGGPNGPDPTSAYNAAISGDGTRILFESSPGNQNFAKRYGRIGIRLAQGGKKVRLDHPVAGVDSQSAYNPAISADGSRGAFEAVQNGRTVIVVTDLPSNRQRVVVRGSRPDSGTFGDPYEESLSADGSKLVYTDATGRVANARAATSQVLVVDVDSGRTTVASTSSSGERGNGFSSDPSISPDGRWVAFTSDATNLGAAHRHAGLFLHDLKTGRTLRISTGDDSVLDPVVSRGAKVVAYTLMNGTTGRVVAWKRSGAKVTLVSRGAGGAADGSSDSPSVSADGTKVAFVSSATNLAAAASDGNRAVYVRDLPKGSTVLVSNPKAAYPKPVLAALAANPPPKPVAAPAPAPLPLSTTAGRDSIFVIDNEFYDHGARPVLKIKPGTVLSWQWDSQQTHSLAVRSGPEKFVARQRNGGDFSHTFTKPGVYHFVCQLHAPGMEMTVVVTKPRASTA